MCLPGDAWHYAGMKTLEQLIEEEMAAVVDRVVRLSQRAAVSAFEAHFHRALKSSADDASSPPIPPSGRKSKRSSSKRRSGAEIVELSDRLLQVVRSDPGQPMSVLAPRLGVTAAELAVPMERLRAARQIKSVGHRHLTRYFPVAQDAAA